MAEYRPWAPLSGAELRTGLLRDEVRRMLPMLTPDQLELFGRIFPGGVDSLSEDSATSAIQLIRRTFDARDRQVRVGAADGEASDGR